AAANTTAIQAAWDACKALGGGIVFVPFGDFKHREFSFNSTYGGCSMRGAGAGSKLRYQPTSGGLKAWHFDGVIDSGLHDLTLYTDDTSVTKTALSLLNTDKFWISRVTLGYAGNNWTGSNSIGFLANGHNYTGGTELFIYANRPMLFDGNVTSDFGN